MGNTKADYWDVAGTSLHTYAWNVDVLPDDGLPPRRGENVVVPGSDGEVWRAKKWGARIFTMGGWISNANQNGSRGATPEDRLAQLNANIKTLKTLFGASSLQTLTRRVRETTGVVAYTADVEFFDFRINYGNGDRTFVRFTVDVHMPDPYWYDPSSNPVL